MLALPVLVARTLWQERRGTLPRGALRERLARTQAPAPAAGPVLWLHGASLGELTSVRWLVARLLAEGPGLSVVVTSNTATARAMVRGWDLPGVTARLAPFDRPGPVGRFLRQWRPDALVVVENELWPERLAACAARGIPVLLIGARLSAGSARNWGRLAPGLMRAMLGQLAAVSAQDAASERRLRDLGLAGDRLLPRLMLKSRAAAPAQARTPPFALPVARDRCLLAASTHEGEEGPILDAFARSGGFDLLILAPRHPNRGKAVAGLIAARGLTHATRSAGEVPGPGTRVYLADTLGEMDHWYGMAGATVIGGTFADRGGHTPFEPAAQGSAILHGPSVANFAEAFASLDAADAAIPLAGAEDLAAALSGLDAERQARLSAAARTVLLPREDEAALIAAIRAALGLDPADQVSG